MRIRLKAFSFREEFKIPLLTAALCILTLATFSRVLSFQFLSYDDEQYVTQNPYIKEGLNFDTLRWAFTCGLSHFNRHCDYWQPLTFLSRIIDIELFGFNSAGHHLMNLIFHLMNVLILFWILLATIKSPLKSFFIACIFAIHPTQAEPVAWVTARKDLLSGFFTLLALASYTCYVQIKTSSRSFFLLSIFSYFCAMLSKPIPMFPLYLLIWDFWPLKRYSTSSSLKELLKIFVEKIPFFLLGASGFIAILSPAMAPSEASKPYLPTTLLSYAHYLQSYFYPVQMGLHGPELSPPPPLWKLLSCLALLLSLFYFCIRNIKNYPFLIAGWLWFFFGLLPLTGGEWVCDRFLYLPMIGLSIMSVFSFTELIKNFSSWKKELFALIFVAFGLLIMLSIHQLDYWKDSRSFFFRAVEINPNNYVALNNAGVFLGMERRDVEARNYFQKSFSLNPNYQEAAINLGVTATQQGRFEEAFRYYQEVLRINPKLTMVHCNLGSLFVRIGRFEEAARSYKTALELDPTHHEARAFLEMVERQMQPRDGPQ